MDKIPLILTHDQAAAILRHCRVDIKAFLSQYRRDPFIDRRDLFKYLGGRGRGICDGL